MYEQPNLLSKSWRLLPFTEPVARVAWQSGRNDTWAELLNLLTLHRFGKIVCSVTQKLRI
jgi:hypothetical protein